MKLTDGVYALTVTVERDGGETAFHPAAVETDRGVVLLDTTLPGMADELEAALGDAGFGFDDVTAVVLTHHDGDHAGALAEVCDRADDPPVYAHEAEAPFVDGREHPIKSDPDAERYPPVPVDVELQDGVTFRTAAGPMRAVFTPGHAPGHLSFVLPEADLLLAGDALTSDDGGVRPPIDRFTPDLREATRSVGRLAELDVDRVHCFHGGPADEGTAGVERVYDAMREDHGDA
ncbi:MBL fold metallo-hydrolase [Candidatus Halobonum tyrrellensis]|uniref:Beta-lactamase domain-containing protein n=1 Tax=Candidatus Halobonum tyrrellensis G22 TaxID=1324957 RepID=V4HFM7_9EURY|nr:MBL fold metallo-hydrolase [Candidatus Halobonum tyrrellensis]ESP89490.1 beta-lactamase domain-containing protein [Candidatus Halobonum tyrrellensis G22]